MRNLRAFTFAELLIGVTVSAIIMTGVVVFVGSGIENSFKIRKGMEENAASADFDAAMQRFASFWGELLYSGAFDAPYGSGAVIKNQRKAVPLAVLATKTVTGVCDAYSETSDVSGTGEALEIFETYSPVRITPTGNLFADTLSHVVRDSASGIVLGNGNPWFAWGSWSSSVATELRYPSSLAEVWGGKWLVADTGNDRVLLLQGGTVTTFLGPESWIRHPHEIATDGVDVRIAWSNGVFGVLWNPMRNGDFFSGSFRSPSQFSFDSMKIVLGWGRAPPSSLAFYAFDFIPAWWSASVSWNVATVGFSGSTYSYSTWSSATVSITGIPAAATPSWSYQATVQYFLGGTKKYERAFPYFIIGDGNPLTLQDNLYERSGDASAYPVRLAYSGGEFAYEDWNSYPSVGNEAVKTVAHSSPRMVRWFRTLRNGRILTVSYEEYVRYDCLWGNHVLRERIWKIPLEK